MEYYIDNGNEVTITPENWPSEISGVTVKNGSLIVKNDSDEIKYLVFSDNLLINVETFGNFISYGKLVKVGETNGEANQVIDLPFDLKYDLGGVFIKKKNGELVAFHNISKKDTEIDFYEFYNGEESTVCKIKNNKIYFSDSTEYSYVPEEGLDILVPNIIFATNGNRSSRFTAGLGGTIGIYNTAFSNFKGLYSDLKKVRIKNSIFLESLYVRQVNGGYIENVLSNYNNNYTQGVYITYSSKIDVLNVSSMCYTGIGFSSMYNSDISIKQIKSTVIKRDSLNDNGVYISNNANIEIKDIISIGGNVNFKNTNNFSAENINVVDNTAKKRTAIAGQSNLEIDTCDNVLIRNITIPEGGAAYNSFVDISNSSKIKIVDLVAKDDYSRYAISMATSFECILGRFKVKGVQENTKVFNINETNSNIILQNIFFEQQPANIIFDAKNSTIKGVSTLDANRDRFSINTNTFQFYNSNTTGKIKFITAEQEEVDIKNGNPILGFDRTELKKGDVVVFKTQTSFSGIEMDEKEPIISGKDIESVKIYFRVVGTNKNSDFVILNKENLVNANSVIKKNKSFYIEYKLDARDMDINAKAYIDYITVNTLDKRFIYSIFYKKIIVIFDDFLIDGKNKFALVYGRGYENKGYPLTDKDGFSITGIINKKENVFMYDFEENDENNRIPNNNTEVILLATTQDEFKPIEIKGLLTVNNDLTMMITPEADKVSLLYKNGELNNE